jgi:cytochrome P450 family 4
LLDRYENLNQFSCYIAWNGYTPEVFTDDLRIISTAVQSPKFLSKGIVADALKDSLGDGLFFSTNEKWHIRRRIITPTFHFKILEQFFENFKKHNRILMDQIDEKTNGESFNVIPLITKTMIDTMCETAMGIDAMDCSQYAESLPELLSLTIKRLVTPLYLVKWIYFFTNLRRDILKHAKVTKEFTTKVINKRREELTKLQSNKENDDDSDIGIKKKACLLDVLLQSSVNDVQLTTDEISEEVDIFMIGGHDTTTNVVSFALYFLATHPEAQEKVVREIEKIIGDEELTFKSIQQFQYLDLVIKETMRLHPPVPVISRRLSEEIEIEGCTFPAKTNFNLMLFKMFRNPEIFPNPDEFIPERFGGDEKFTFSYIPFSAVSI